MKQRLVALLLNDFSCRDYVFRPPFDDIFFSLFLYYFLRGAKVAVYKTQLFTNLRGKAKKVLEIGIGTGPNLKYYANSADVQVFGVDPNTKMEKYAQESAVAAGLPLSNFEFIQAVCMFLL